MHKALMFAAALAVGAPAAAPAQDQTETTTKYCNMLTSEGTAYAGPCDESYNYTTGDHYVSFPGNHFRIEDYEPMRHEGNWMFLKINGAPAVAYMHHRSWLEYALEDLSMVLNVCDEADEFGNCAN